jgi:ABC-2 type transport system ATP-binding protein
LRKPPDGMKPRNFQAQLLAEPDVIDAVPESGQIRLVMQANSAGSAGQQFAGVAARPTPPRFGDGFMVLLHEARGAHATDQQTPATQEPAIGGASGESIVEVRDLVRRFGKFVAVDRVSFVVKRGEIFGLLGPNGAGKTTTFRMLCGLLPPSAGTLTVAGVDVRQNRASARQHLGYVAQKFSLYGQLTAGENLDFFARAYGLEGAKKRERIAWALSQFKLEPFVRLPGAQLPGGFKQRLAMAAALLHRPEILFLDEPTSGADPFARREFWQRITALAAGGVTVIVTTHFMEEAEYCDRALILDDGKVLAQGTPAELRALVPVQAGRVATMEDAFIAIVEKGTCRARAEVGLKAPHEGLAGKMAADLGADAQGNATDPSRSEQHRHRHRLPGDDDSAVRLRTVARCHPGLCRRHRPTTHPRTVQPSSERSGLSPYFKVKALARWRSDEAGARSEGGRHIADPR